MRHSVDDGYGSDLTRGQGVLSAALYAWNHPRHAGGTEPPVRPFVTISREPGAGAVSLSRLLVERLNEQPGGDWTAWDSELFGRMSAFQSVEADVMEALKDQRLDWLDEILKKLSGYKDAPESAEIQTYKRVAMMIRALAMAGHTVLVGRGAQFVTAHMPGGIHLRLVAPLEHGIKFISRMLKLSADHAALWIAQRDKERELFYQRFWPHKQVRPEAFSVVMNSAEWSADELAECVHALIRIHETRGQSAPERHHRWFGLSPTTILKL